VEEKVIIAGEESKEKRRTYTLECRVGAGNIQIF
jgi:hypothetical protein